MVFLIVNYSIDDLFNPKIEVPLYYDYHPVQKQKSSVRRKNPISILNDKKQNIGHNEKRNRAAKLEDMRNTNGKFIRMDHFMVMQCCKQHLQLISFKKVNKKFTHISDVFEMVIVTRQCCFDSARFAFR